MVKENFKALVERRRGQQLVTVPPVPIAETTSLANGPVFTGSEVEEVSVSFVNRPIDGVQADVRIMIVPPHELDPKYLPKGLGASDDARLAGSGVIHTLVDGMSVTHGYSLEYYRLPPEIHQTGEVNLNDKKLDLVGWVQSIPGEALISVEIRKDQAMTQQLADFNASTSSVVMESSPTARIFIDAIATEELKVLPELERVYPELDGEEVEEPVSLLPAPALQLKKAA